MRMIFYTLMGKETIKDRLTAHFVISSEYQAKIYTMPCSKVQCNLDLVTLLVSAKTVTKSHNITKSNYFM